MAMDWMSGVSIPGKGTMLTANDYLELKDHGPLIGLSLPFSVEVKKS
jgi:hypothetical protein